MVAPPGTKVKEGIGTIVGFYKTRQKIVNLRGRDINKIDMNKISSAELLSKYPFVARKVKLKPKKKPKKKGKGIEVYMPVKDIGGLYTYKSVVLQEPQLQKPVQTQKQKLKTKSKQRSSYLSKQKLSAELGIPKVGIKTGVFAGVKTRT